MENILKHMPLAEGEKVRSYLYGDSYNTNPNAIVRLVALIIRILSVVLGISKKKHILVTNKRIIAVDFQKVFWFINNGIEAFTYTPRSINEIGYARRRSILIFVTHYFLFNNHIVKSMNGKDAVYEMITAANDLAEKVTSNKESHTESDAHQIQEKVIPQEYLNESLSNLQWQTHYMKLLSEK